MMNESAISQCFELVALAGDARSSFIEAVQCASNGDYDQARQLVDEGEKRLNDGHAIHAQMLVNEGRGEVEYSGLIAIHAEDQMMSAEGFGILSEMFIDLYHQIDKRAEE